MATKRTRKTNATAAATATPKADVPSKPEGPRMMRVRGGEAPVRATGEKSGLKVSQAYKAIFEANERLAHGEAPACDLSLFKGAKAPLTDEQIKVWLEAEYGTRGNNNHLNVSRNRKAFVDGIYPKAKDGEDKRVSHGYDANGKPVAPRMRKAKATETSAKADDASQEAAAKPARRRTRTKK